MGQGNITLLGPYTTPAALRAGMEGGAASPNDVYYIVNGAGNQQYWAIMVEGAP